MPMYQPDDFTADVLPAAFKKDTKEIIVVAAALGWKVHLTTGNSVTIIAPEERKKYHFGLNGRASINHNRIRRDIIKYGDPEKVLAISAADALGMNSPEALAILQSSKIDMSVGATVVDETPKPEPRTTTPKRLAAKQGSRTESEAPVSEQREAHIVSERPMLARSSGDDGYESPTTIERKWSDGSKDYKCVECNYTSAASRGSVAAHYGKSHSKPGGRGEKPETFKVDIPDARVYSPRQTRIDALAEWIGELIRGEGDPKEVAKAALTWVNEQSRRGTSFAAEREELSAEDTLSRIKMMLDDGSYFRQRQELETLEQRMADMEEQVLASQTRADEAEARADEAWGNLRALRSLIADIGDEEVKAAAG